MNLWSFLLQICDFSDTFKFINFWLNLEECFRFKFVFFLALIMEMFIFSSKSTFPQLKYFLADTDSSMAIHIYCLVSTMAHTLHTYELSYFTENGKLKLDKLLIEMTSG